METQRLASSLFRSFTGPSATAQSFVHDGTRCHKVVLHIEHTMQKRSTARHSHYRSLVIVSAPSSRTTCQASPRASTELACQQRAELEAPKTDGLVTDLDGCPARLLRQLLQPHFGEHGSLVDAPLDVLNVVS